MRFVILAAGEGTRMGSLARDIPKHLIEIKGRPILARVLESLPQSASPILVIRNQGEKIKKYFGNYFGKLPLEYVWQDESMPGTGGALWSVKNMLGNEKFLVLNGDDIHSSEFIDRMTKEKLAFGVIEKEWNGYLSVYADEAGNLADLRPKEGKKVVAVGAYTLDERIFNYKPVLGKSGEYGLPRTILQMAKDFPVKLVQSDFFVSLNTPEDLKFAEDMIP